MSDEQFQVLLAAVTDKLGSQHETQIKGLIDTEGDGKSKHSTTSCGT